MGTHPIFESDFDCLTEWEMSVIREFSCFDLFKFNKVNLDPLTETYGLTFYMTYQAKWPEYFYTAESPNGEIQGYIMGKAEGNDDRKQWHGHVTALTVQPNYRRLGLARKLMNLKGFQKKRILGLSICLFEKKIQRLTNYIRILAIVFIGGF